MNQSKAEDTTRRVYAAEMAKAVVNHVESYPVEDFITITRDIYLFLSGKDPVIDPPPEDSGNVIQLADYR